MSENTLRKILSLAPGVDLCVIEPDKMMPEADANHGCMVKACIRYNNKESDIECEMADGTVPDILCWPVYFGELQCPFDPDDLDEYIARCAKEEQIKEIQI